MLSSRVESLTTRSPWRYWVKELRRSSKNWFGGEVLQTGEMVIGREREGRKDRECRGEMVKRKDKDNIYKKKGGGGGGRRRGFGSSSGAQSDRSVLSIPWRV